MATEVRLVIKDSCILFDLMELDLMDTFFSLSFEVFTTAFVIDEIADEAQLSFVNSFIESGLLKVDNKATFETIQAIYEECNGLSFPDCSIVEFVMRSDGLVLSSDKALRKEILKRDFDVRGLLWAIDELLQNGHLSAEQAIQKLVKYKEINRRAPVAEIEKRIDIYKEI